MTDHSAVIHLTADDIQQLTHEIDGAYSARIMVQDGGVKVSAQGGMWSLPIGSTEQR
jgi:hypothetical protein